MCKLKGERDCRKTSLKVDAKYFWSSLLALGNVTDISKSCMCISTRYCVPLNSIFKLFLPFKSKILNIHVRVEGFEQANNNSDTMSVEVLNPSSEYVDFAERVATA
jgi:hypothetical protein